MLHSLVLCLAASFVGGDIVINEFAYDDTGPDDREFVELYNKSTKDVDISGWLIAAEDPIGPNASYVIPPNTRIKAGGFYVVGSAKVPNVDQVVGAHDLWENAQESLSLRDARGQLVDTLVYEAWRGVWNTSLAEGEGIWGEFVSIEENPTSWARIPDGFDTDNNRDFRLVPATPGASNDLPAGGSRDDFDKRKPETPLPDFGGSFARPHVIDPTKTSAHNPAPIPVSPQGGLAAAFWDPAGGGNHTMLLRAPTRDIVVEAWVYLDATPAPTLLRQAWSLGVQGTSGTFYQFPNLSGQDASFANGNTGIAWSYDVTDQGGTLWLYDHNDGGWGARASTKPVQLAKIPIKKGVNDGWQRLRLGVAGNRLEAFFGGTWGCADGKRIDAAIPAPASGGVYVSYREAYGSGNRTKVRPFTCDRLRIGADTSVVEHFGTAKAHTRSTPRITVKASPMLGRADFSVLGSDLIAGSLSVVVVGFRRLPNPLDLTPLGAAKGTLLYVQSDFLLFVTNDSQGRAKVVFPIPCLAAANGFALHWQLFDLDPALQNGFPFGHSDGMTTTIGN